MTSHPEAPPIGRIHSPSAWTAATLRNDRSWVIQIGDEERRELVQALAHFKKETDRARLTAQWLHGNLIPKKTHFPLNRLASLMRRVQNDIESKYGIVLLKGFPTDGFSNKELRLMHTGLCSYVGTVRPQTMFGEMLQEIKDNDQAAHLERRGSKHNLPLSFHNDPCDVVSFLCLQRARRGGQGRFVSAVAVHNAMLKHAPDAVRTLYGDYPHTYQDYLFVKTGLNDNLLPRQSSYLLPIFSVERGAFASKYSRFYIDQADERGTKLSRRQVDALVVFENEMRKDKWQLHIDYEPGDLLFINNFVCFHSRTAFEDDPDDETLRRQLFRVWLSVPNSRPLSPRYANYFFQNVEAGAVRGGLPLPDIRYF